MTTRAEHMAFCKARALRDLAYYLEHKPESACQNAFASMASDLDKHDETRGHRGVELGMVMLLAGQLNTPDSMKRFIEGFN